jgi:hypothetical protein
MACQVSLGAELAYQGGPSVAMIPAFEQNRSMCPLLRPSSRPPAGDLCSSRTSTACALPPMAEATACAASASVSYGDMRRALGGEALAERAADAVATTGDRNNLVSADP